MPELPEVEVVKKSLNETIYDLTIINIEILNKFLRYKIQEKLMKKMVKSKVISVSRRSKYILVNLDNNYTIMFHLGMTGKFYIIKKDLKLKKLSFYYKISNKLSKHDHIIFHFNKNKRLIYNDIRKFGFIKILGFSRFDFIKYFSSLGPEPLSKAFNKNYLSSKCKQSKKKIKNFLMDQKYVSGLGNIYVNEILFYSSINPRKLSNKLSGDQISKIVFSTKKILKKAIQLGCSSIKDFNSFSGKKGGFQKNFKVYNRVKKSCFKRKCKGTIKKIYISNRSTFFCPKCQNN